MQGLAQSANEQTLLANRIRKRGNAMINKFTTVYAGHIDMPDRGKESTPASEDLIELIKGFEEQFPGLEYINLSMPMCTPESAMLEQYNKIAEEVMPHFGGGENAKAAAG